MGNFYTNFTVFGASSEEVLAVTRELRRTAYVMQSVAGASVLFDSVSDEQDVDEIERLGALLSGRLGSPVLACLNHDDDHLLLWVFREEKKEGFYQSCIDAPRFAWALARIRGGMLSYPFIVAVLGWPIVLFAHLRHSALASLLSLPKIAVGYGYNSLSRGEIPIGHSKDEIHRA